MKKVTVKCPNCNGTGHIAHYDYNCQGVCFRCNGTGEIIEKQYTEKELQAKIKRTEKKMKEKEDTWLKNARGFKNTDTLYIVNGNTYEIKEELKQAGAKWNMWFRAWTFENDNLKDKYDLEAKTFESTL
jgi:RecJ-like exonuclease